jgi:hypothetical protein
MVPTFLSAEWSEEAFHRPGAQDVESLILVNALFQLDGGRREGKKKNHMGEEGFIIAPPSWLCRGSQLLGAIKG